MPGDGWQAPAGDLHAGRHQDVAQVGQHILDIEKGARQGSQLMSVGSCLAQHQSPVTRATHAGMHQVQPDCSCEPALALEVGRVLWFSRRACPTLKRTSDIDSTPLQTSETAGAHDNQRGQGSGLPTCSSCSVRWGSVKLATAHAGTFFP